MYAIIRTGGKQYRVQPGDVIRVEKLEQPLGTEVELTDVLMIGGEAPVLGKPLVEGAKVTVVITKQAKDRKIIIFKKRRRQGYRRLKGHRQQFTELFVKAIAHGSKVEKSDVEAQVIDVDKERMEKIQAKVEARKQRAQSRTSEETTEEVVATPAKKKARKAAPKKKAKAKGKSGNKKTAKSKKKATKKVAKKK